MSTTTHTSSDVTYSSSNNTGTVRIALEGSSSLTVALPDGSLKLISKEVPYFYYIRDVIKQNPEAVFSVDKPLDIYIDQILHNKGWFDRFDGVSEPLRKVILKLYQKNLPIDPLISFWEKASTLEPAKRNLLSEMVANRHVELSWEGNIVLYSRPAYFKTKVDWDMRQSEGFEPLAYREFSEPVPVGTFDWVSLDCSDQGRIFDVLVSPADIQDITYGRTEIGYISQDGSYQLSTRRYQCLSMLPEAVKNSVSVIYRKTDSLGTSVLVREPYSPEALRSYAETVLTNSQFTLERLDPSPSNTGSC